MKKFRFFFILAASIGMLSSCALDNFEPPTAELYGSIIDEETGELVQQDIISGAVIELREHGYDPVTPQFLEIGNDGTYRDSRLFANTYTVEPLRTNFHPVAPQEVVIEGKTQLDFLVTPYIRINNVNIIQEGNKVIATFTLEQTGVNNVREIGLYAHLDPHVGEPMYLGSVEKQINAVVDSDEVFTLEFDITTDPDITSGNQYFFRVGALIDVPEANFNYAPAVRLDI